MERVADYIIQKLHEKEINHIFLVTGRGILFLSDAVARENEFEGISTYHEQGASYAAMAYAQARDDFGACLVSTGCAATNAVTAALCAWQDNIPVVFISGQHMLEETTRYTGIPLRTFGSQEADIVEIVKPITKYAVMITDPKQIAVELEKAFHLAVTGRKGPVWIDVPLDVQNMRIDPQTLVHFYPAEKEESVVLESDVREVLAELNSAKRPLILIGGGVRSAGAQQQIAQFVELTEIPLVFTPSAADVYGTTNDLSIGAIGSIGGSRSGNFAIQNADYILAIGTKLCSQATGTDYKTFARSSKITIVDIDPVEHTKPAARIDKVIIADAKEFLNIVLSKANELNPALEAWKDKCCHWKDQFHISNEAFIQEQAEKNVIDIYSFSHCLSKRLGTEAVVITDAGFEELIVPSTISYGKNQRCLFPAAQGAMGYAIPAILGAHFAGKKDIVTIVGDGSIMMNLQELQAISFHEIPAKIFVMNNDMYAVIRKRQRDLFRSRTIGNDPTDGVAQPNFEKLANSFNINYVKIEDLMDLEKKLDTVLKLSGPVICEVMCIAEQKFLHKSYAINEKRRLVSRPLEDLSPFMEREELKQEMMIPPID